jgi:hypothetical protein
MNEIVYVVVPETTEGKVDLGKLAITADKEEAKKYYDESFTGQNQPALYAMLAKNFFGHVKNGLNIQDIIACNKPVNPLKVLL